MKTDCTGSLRMLLPPYKEESSPSREESGDYAELQKGRQAAVQGAVGVHFLVPSPGGSPSSRTDQVWIEEVLATSKNPLTRRPPCSFSGKHQCGWTTGLQIK